MKDIDFVIAWVDGSDSAWQEKKSKYEQTDDRDIYYRDWAMLPYLFRSIEMYAPWVHHVYLVTDKQIPSWLNISHPKLTVVDHRDFIPTEYLPTFNANTIELNVYRIKGLKEQFVFWNDDVFLTSSIKKTDFFVGGKPVDEGTLNGINGKDEVFASIQYQNIALMNQHYDIRACRKNAIKWLNPIYGKNMIRTLLLWPFARLQGIYNSHGPVPLLKTTCEKVWERDKAVLDETCRCKIRNKNNVSCYAFRYEQLLSGDFIPARAMNRYHQVGDSLKEIQKSMKKAKTICINDETLNQKMFVKRKKALHRLMEWKYPHKSQYEK